MIAVPVTQVLGSDPFGPLWLETALFTATGWKCLHPVADEGGWKTRLKNLWQNPILRVFQPGV